MLWTVGKDGLLEIDFPIVRDIPEFKILLTRDKGSIGDSTGRDKLKAKKELKFIWLSCHVDSPFIDIPEKERMDMAARQAGLPEDFKIDKEIKSAMLKFIYFMELELPSAGILINLKRTLISCNKLVGVFETRIEQLLQNKETSVEDLTTVQSLIEGVVDATNSINKSLNIVSELMVKVSIERSDNRGTSLATGGRQIGNRED